GLRLPPWLFTQPASDVGARAVGSCVPYSAAPHRTSCPGLPSMNRQLHCLRVAASTALLAACSGKTAPAPVAELTPAQALEKYAISKDVAYGSDPQQTMDVYLPQAASWPRRPTYTVVFMHGGGYYQSDKTREERYIRPYLQRGVTVVNLNYRLKR